MKIDIVQNATPKPLEKFHITQEELEQMSEVEILKLMEGEGLGDAIIPSHTFNRMQAELNKRTLLKISKPSTYEKVAAFAAVIGAITGIAALIVALWPLSQLQAPASQPPASQPQVEHQSKPHVSEQKPLSTQDKQPT